MRSMMGMDIHHFRRGGGADMLGSSFKGKTA
jgi:hypothetical protein